MSTPGYVRVYRSLQDHWLFADKPFCELAAWADLLLLAAFKPHTNRHGRTQRRGDVFTSPATLAKRWGWTRAKVRRFLARLHEREMVQLVSGKAGTCVTICNYDVYQSDGARPTERPRDLREEKGGKRPTERPTSVQGVIQNRPPERPCLFPAENDCKRPPERPESGHIAATTEEGNKGKKNNPAPNGATIWAAWVDVHHAKGLQEPARVGPDLKAGKVLAGVVKSADVPALLFAYLADADPFIVKQGHALRLLPGRVNAYLNPRPPQNETEADAAERIRRELRTAQREK